jgi:hypothetical protein
MSENPLMKEKLLPRDDLLKYLDMFQALENKRGLWFDEYLIHNAIVLLKEQEEHPGWVSCKDEFPKKDGDYLVVQEILGKYHTIGKKSYAKNMRDVDKYCLPEGPGWYGCDSEEEHYECENVLYWMPMPKLPEELRKDE